MNAKRGVSAYALIATGLIVIATIGWFFFSYNRLVHKEEAVKAAWSQVESNLQRKLDLLPNLVKVVKRYAAHEEKVLGEITALRSGVAQALGKSDDPAKISALNKRLDGALGAFMLRVENYPELKSSEEFLQLQSQIEGAENRINITRMQFNEAVRDYNAYLRTIPANIVASIAHFAPKAYFKADKAAHQKMEIDL